MDKQKPMKERIVTAAWELFHQKGYNETTIDDILAAAKISKGSFYHYFTGKDTLLNSIYLIFDAKYEELIQEMDPDMNSFDKLIYLCVSLHQMIEKQIPLDLLAYLYSSQIIPKEERPLLDHNRYYYKIIDQIVDEGQRRGQIRSDMRFYEISKFYSLCERSILYDWCICKGNYALGEYTEKFLPMLFSCMRGEVD